MKSAVRTVARFFSPRQALLDEYRWQWGRRSEDSYRDFATIRSLFDLTRDQQHRDCIDDLVWTDLDMDRVFAELDTCISPMGQQTLYRMLREYQTDTEKLATNFGVVEAVQSHDELRESLQLELHAIKDPHLYLLTNMLFDDLPEKPKHHWAIYVLSIASVVSLAAIAWSAVFIVTSALIIIANFFVAVRLSDRLYYYSRGYATLNAFLTVAERIGALRIKSSIPHMSYLQQSTKQTSRLRRGFRLVAVNRQGGIGAVELVFYWLNLVCLLDVVVFLRSIDRLQRGRPEIIELFDRVAFLDAAISLGNYLLRLDTYANPTFGPINQLDFVDVVHPLVSEPVPNSLSMANKSALITGSNMAGKTTMIKTVGVNIVLAQTIWVVLAKSATIPKDIRVSTSIKREDSLEFGKSYYFVEIERLLAHIQEAQASGNSIFLLDEIFRGTNTVERVSAAVAVLEKLSDANLVLVTTHDVELQDLLVEFDMYHFRENADASNLFSYKIRVGPSTTRNAIELLKIIGYPEDVTARADEMTKVVSRLNKLDGGASG